MDFIKGVLYRVPGGEAVDIPLRHLAAFGVTRDSGKTTFIESAVAASQLRAITFRTKRGEIGFEGAKQLQIFFDERGLTHWKALEGLIAATLEEKVSHEPGIRGGIITVCTRPTQAVTLEEVHERVKSRLQDPKVRGFVQDVFNKLDAYLTEVLPQIRQLRPKFTNKLELPEQGVYVEDLTGLSDEIQSLLLASIMKKCYEESTGIIVVLPEVWKFLPQDRGSPVKWVIEKYVREMGAVEGYLWIDCQDLRGVDKKHLRSIDVRLFGRQPDPHEIDELLKALPLPRGAKPTPQQIMTLKLGHFYAKLRDTVELVYVRPLWLPEEVAVQVARGELAPESREVQKFRPESRVLEVNDEVYREKFDEEHRIRETLEKALQEYSGQVKELQNIIEEERKKREEVEREFARQLERLSNLKAEAMVKEANEEADAAEQHALEAERRLEPFERFTEALGEVMLPLLKKNAVGVMTPNGVSSEASVSIQPTLTEFTVKSPKREVLEFTDKDTAGQILTLAARGWFAERRKTNHVRDELKRVFNSAPRPGTIETALGDLTTKAVLEREREGTSWIYWLAPRAKDLIRLEDRLIES